MLKYKTFRKNYRFYMNTYLNTMDTISSKIFVNKFKNIVRQMAYSDHLSTTCQD